MLDVGNVIAPWLTPDCWIATSDVTVLRSMMLPTNLERPFVVDLLPLSDLEQLADLLARA